MPPVLARRLRISLKLKPRSHRKRRGGAPPYKVNVYTRSWRLERVYTFTLYGGAPPRRFRCERASIQSQRIDAFVWRRAAPPLMV